MTSNDDTALARGRPPTSAILAVVAGGNLVAAPALVALWLLRRHGFIQGPPYWVFLLIITVSIVLDIWGRIWMQRRPTSRLRQQGRVALGAAVVTAVLYASGLGAAVNIAYGLCAVQMLAQIRGIDWRSVLGWCAGCTLAGELAVQLGLVPHLLPIGKSHLLAAIGLVILGAALWVVSGILAERDSTEQELRHREVRFAHDASTDSLTQLVNRAAFTIALERSCAANEPSILAFVDLDNFKDINDSFGHHMGDHVLIEVASRLRRVVREDDLIARFGGDEFVILVKSSPDETDADRLVERIWHVLAEPWPEIAPNAISASVGVVDDRAGTRSPEDLLRQADKAMYARKHGMSSTGSMAAMTSRALAHHRRAMDGMRGSFAVLRAVREGGEIVDFEIIEANALVRKAMGSDRGSIVGARLSAFSHQAEYSVFMPLYTEVLSTGMPFDAELHVELREGDTVWRDVNVITVDRDVVAVIANDITAEVQARSELDRERARFASLIARSSDLACVVDHDGRVAYLPPSGVAFLGYAANDLERPLAKVIPADNDEVAAWFAEIPSLPTGTPARSLTARFGARDGGVHTCDITAVNHSDDAAISGIVLNVHDISRVVAAEARLAAVANAVSEMIAVCDENGRVTWASGAVRAGLGIEPDDLVGVSAFEIIHPDERPLIAARLVAMLADPRAFSPPLDLRLRRADGTYRWFESSGSNQLADPSIRGIVISLRDTTDRRSGEAALRMSEERNRSIVEAAADAIMSVDAHGNIQSFNRAAERIFAVRAGEVIGHRYDRFLPPGSLEMVRSTLAIAGGDARIDTVATRSSGEQFPVEVAVSRVQVGVSWYHTAMVHDVSDRRAMEEALRTAATCDDLTGLPNRRTLLDRTHEAIEEARRTDDVVGMVFVDLDRFKLVNDGLGHDAGDQLLVDVANRIAGVIRAQDVVARLGSDEFVVLCPSASDLDAIKTVALRIVDALTGAFVIFDNEVFVGASIGISVSTGTETPIELLRFADTAMYRAKENRNSRVEVFDTRMQRNAARRLDVESALRQATGRDELRAYYQPIVSLQTGRVANLEALIRWDRRGVGLIRPDNFIPIAEEAGIILEIGAWMMRTATVDCARWQQVAPGIGVSVNVSVRQFESGDLVSVVQSALANSGLDPTLLTLEITESVMLDHSDRNAAIMRRIRDLGMHISLDDFGSGYSSLTYLRLLPIDSIKIDRSFLQSLGSAVRDMAMLSAIVNLGTAHDLAVVAEGIDTEAKLSAVRAVGCTFGQGFLFAKPMPLGATLEYLTPADAHSAARSRAPANTD